jgi:hypothetical protein
MTNPLAHHRMLGTPGLDRFGMSILRYQFPQNRKPGDTDSNWLMVQGEVRRRDDSWTFADPCLLTSELQELITWLEQPAQAKSSIWFMEPLLRFEWQFDAADMLTLQLRAEAIPERVLTGRARWDEGIALELAVSRQQIQTFAAGLADDLRRFPPR